MISWLRRRLTYANVISTITVFIVLGGVAYAAKQITGKQIKNNSVTSADIKNRTLRTKDLRKSVVRSVNSGTREARRSRGPNNAAAREFAPITSITGLDPGAYVFKGKTNISGELGTFVSCRLTAGRDVDVSSRGIRPGGDPPEEVGVQLAASLGTGGAVVFECRSGRGTWSANDTSLTATRVRSVTKTNVSG